MHRPISASSSTTSRPPARPPAPERSHFLVHSAERGHLWREAIQAHHAGEPGIPAGDAIQAIADELQLKP